MNLENSKIIILGGTSGIGLAAARLATQRGAIVAIGGRDPDRLTAAQRSAGVAIARPVDAADARSLVRFFAAVGEFDHLVIAASGGRGGGALETLEEDDLRSAFEAKFWVHWRAAKAASRLMSDHGSITFVSSASARASNAGTSGLAAVNGAINAMIGPLARELAPRRVNAVSPGVVDTAWWDSQPAEMKNAFFQASRATLPVGRIGQPDDVAEAILFLVGNGFTTGTILDVDGGLRMASTG